MEICFFLDKGALTELFELENHVAMFRYCVLPTVCRRFSSKG